MSMPDTFMHQFRQMKQFQDKAFESSCILQPEATNVQDRMELWTGREGWAVLFENVILLSSSLSLLTDYLQNL